MRRVFLILPLAVALAVGATLITVSVAATGIAPSATATAASGPRIFPPWLKAAEMQTLDRVFGGARPIHTNHIWYPRKIAVVFEFNRVVVCGLCPSLGNVSLPRGRVIRLSYDRQTHRQNDGIRFCESRGAWPPRAACLRR